jgi:WD40 repeat protein
LFPIFRDQDELAGSSDLGAKLREALRASRNLIVVCSPRAAQSRWVNEEIDEFNKLGRSDRILCVVSEGDPESTDVANRCFPPSLKGEPLAVDLRDGGSSKGDARLQLVAGMLGLSLDELKRRDHQRRVRVAIISSIAVVTLMAIISALSLFGWQQRTVAEARTMAAASVQATYVREDPVTGRDLAIQAMKKAPLTAEVRSALMLAIEHQRSLLILRHESDVHRAVFSSDGSRILTCGAESAARIWSASTGKILTEIIESGVEIRICSFSPDASMVVTSLGDATLRVWEAATGELSAELLGHKDRVASAQFSADGKRLVSASSDGSFRVWDVTTGEVQILVKVSEHGIRAAFFVAEGSAILAIANNGRISIWELASQTKLQEFGDPMPGVHDAVLSHDGKQLLVANYQYRPYLWQLANPARLIGGAMAIPHVSGAAFSADGTTLVLGGGDGFVSVFDTTEGYQIKRLQHPGMVASLAFSPSGGLIVTAADKIRIWETPVLGGGVENEREILRGHAGDAYITGFAPGDESRILTIGMEDNTVRIWDVSNPGTRIESLVLSDSSDTELLEFAQSKVPIQIDVPPHSADTN